MLFLCGCKRRQTGVLHIAGGYGRFGTQFATQQFKFASSSSSGEDGDVSVKETCVFLTQATKTWYYALLTSDLVVSQVDQEMVTWPHSRYCRRSLESEQRSHGLENSRGPLTNKLTTPVSNNKYLKHMKQPTYHRTHFTNFCLSTFVSRAKLRSAVRAPARTFTIPNGRACALWRPIRN